MQIERAKLPKGMSYPLKPSFLQAALSCADVDTEARFVQVVRGFLFDAHFWPPSPNVAHERLYLRAGAVSAAWSRVARAYLETSVIPEFVAWMQGILSLPVNSPVRREKQYFARSLPAHLTSPCSGPPKSDQTSV